MQKRYTHPVSEITPLRSEAETALADLVGPLADLAFDLGFGAQETETVFRFAFVKSLACRQLEAFGRVNISGIAASTGVPRGEVSRILKLDDQKKLLLVRKLQAPTNRILAAWHNETPFTDSIGRPIALEIFGPGVTFELLAKKYGGGIPARALLDELTRTRSVEVISSQKVRVNDRYAAHPWLTLMRIKSLNDTTASLVCAHRDLTRPPRVRASVFTARVDARSKSRTALAKINQALSAKMDGIPSDIDARDDQVRSRISDGRRKKRITKLRVTLSFQEGTSKAVKRLAKSPKGRRNLRRLPVSRTNH